MALTVSGLSAAIKAQLDAAFPLADHPTASATRQDYCDKLANGIVTYMVASNVVATTSPGGPGTGKFT